MQTLNHFRYMFIENKLIYILKNKIRKIQIMFCLYIKHLTTQNSLNWLQFHYLGTLVGFWGNLITYLFCNVLSWYKVAIKKPWHRVNWINIYKLDDVNLIIIWFKSSKFYWISSQNETCWLNCKAISISSLIYNLTNTMQTSIYQLNLQVE